MSVWGYMAIITYSDKDTYVYITTKIYSFTLCATEKNIFDIYLLFFFFWKKGKKDLDNCCILKCSLTLYTAYKYSCLHICLLCYLILYKQMFTQDIGMFAEMLRIKPTIRRVF